MSKIIGIDFGTENCRVAVMEGGKPVMIPNADGAFKTPSLIAWQDGLPLAGCAAARAAMQDPRCVIFPILRYLGTDHTWDLPGKRMTPEEAAAILLQQLVLDAERYLGEEVWEAVITVPASFSYLQRKAMRNAGRIAGIEVKRLIHPATAAALTCAVKSDDDRKIMILDAGKGCTEISLLEVGSGVVEVCASGADKALGTDVLSGKKAVEDTSDGTVSGPADALAKLIKHVLTDAGFSMTELSTLYVTGGGAWLLRIREMIRKISAGIEPRILSEDSAALGAALEGGKLSGDSAAENILLLDATPKTLSLETAGGVSTVMIERNTSIPTRKGMIFSTSADMQKSVDVTILEGDHEQAKDNLMIASFNMKGFPLVKAGVPQLEVILDIDTKGILSVSASDQKTGEKLRITGTREFGMPQQEIKRAAQEAVKWKAALRSALEQNAAGQNKNAVGQNENAAGPYENAAGQSKNAAGQIKNAAGKNAGERKIAEDTGKRNDGPNSGRNGEPIDRRRAGTAENKIAGKAETRPPEKPGGNTDPSSYDEKTIREMLPVFDSIWYGLMQMSAEERRGSTAAGMLAVQKQMLATLEKMGVTPIPALNMPFDPYVHEAVGHITDDACPSGYVIKEVRKGFRCGSRILRVSQVIVVN